VTPVWASWRESGYDHGMRTAVITGASAGIGAACARAFAREGLHVVVAARRADRLDRLAGEIRADGGAATPVVADVTSEADMARLVASAHAATGRLDVMVCNAGIGFNGRLDETPTDVMRQLMEVNYFGTFFAARAAVAHFRQIGTGHLFIVSSIVGRRGLPRGGAYSATKFAQAGLGESIRAELTGTGIHVSLVYPVSTETEFRDTMASNFGLRVRGAGPSQSPDQVAAAMVRCLRRPRADVYPLRGSRLVGVLSALLPGLSDRVSARFARAPDPHE
jgi:NADP-dependent 3-hydroxy acid dehydrogenase YdfG